VQANKTMAFPCGKGKRRFVFEDKAKMSRKKKAKH